MRIESLALQPRTPLEDQWFAALDGQIVSDGVASLPIHILGIHRQGRDVWIQLAPFHEDDCEMVIQCRANQTPVDVLAAICDRLCSAGMAHQKTARSDTRCTPE